MKKMLLFPVLILTVGFLSASDKNIVVKKIVTNTDENNKNQKVEVEIENNEMTLTIEQDGAEKVFTVNVKDEKAMNDLKDELEKMGCDINILALTGDENDRVFLSDDDDIQAFRIVKNREGGYLGVQIQDMTEQLRAYFKVKDKTGVLVTEVVEGSPAEKAGLKAGDIITKVNAQSISDADELTKTVRNEKPESKANITVIRDGREKSFSATLGKSDEPLSWASADGDFDVFMPRNYDKMMKKRIFLNHNDELDEIREELKKLKEEIEALKK